MGWDAEDYEVEDIDVEFGDGSSPLSAGTRTPAALYRGDIEEGVAGEGGSSGKQTVPRKKGSGTGKGAKRPVTPKASPSKSVPKPKSSPKATSKTKSRATLIKNTKATLKTKTKGKQKLNLTSPGEGGEGSSVGGGGSSSSSSNSPGKKRQRSPGSEEKSIGGGDEGGVISGGDGGGSTTVEHGGVGNNGGAVSGGDGGSGGGGGAVGGGGSSRPAWMRQRWVQVGKTDEEANLPVEPSPVTDADFDEMVRSCIRNDAMDEVKAKRASLHKRLQVSYVLRVLCFYVQPTMARFVDFVGIFCFW